MKTATLRFDDMCDLIGALDSYHSEVFNRHYGGMLFVPSAMQGKLAAFAGYSIVSIIDPRGRAVDIPWKLKSKDAAHILRTLLGDVLVNMGEHGSCTVRLRLNIKFSAYLSVIKSSFMF